MRFCMVTTFYPPYNFGGDGVFVQALARLLVQSGHEVSVIHCEDAYRLRGQVRAEQLPASHVAEDGVIVHRIKSRYGALSPLLSHQLGRPALKGQELKSLLAEPYDVINYHNVSLMGGPGVLKFGAAPVKLYTIHEHWLICATHILWKYRRKACDGRECLRCSIDARIPPQWWRYTAALPSALEQIDHFISPSRFTANQHRTIFGELPIAVLPHFSRLNSTREPPQAGQGFLYVGRLTASKGVEGMLRVFAGMPRHNLTVVGAGDLFDPLRVQYQKHDNIRFLPFADEAQLPAIYAGARTLILPSIAPETFGLTVVEAMACGTPAIVRDAGGCAEIVRETGIGTVYSSDQELVEAIMRADSDAAGAHILAQEAAQTCARHFSAERYVNQYLGLVRSLR